MKTQKKNQYMMAFEIPKEIHDILKEVARKNDRSVSAEMRRLVMEFLGLKKIPKEKP